MQAEEKGIGTGKLSPVEQILDKLPTATVSLMENKMREACRLAAMGFNIQEISTHTGLTYTVVETILDSEVGHQMMTKFNEAIDKATIEVKNVLTKLAPDALAVLYRTLMDEDTKLEVRAKIAFGILDRLGYGPITRVVGSLSHGVFTPDQIVDIRNRAMEAGLMAVMGKLENRDNVVTINMVEGDDGNGRTKRLEYRVEPAE